MLTQKRLFLFITLLSSLIPSITYAQWIAIEANNGNQVLYGTNSHDQGLALVCTDGDLTIKYLEPDNSTPVTDGKEFPGSLTISSDGDNLTTRNAVFYARHTLEHAGLISGIKNMPATVRKVLRGLRDSNKQIIVSANYYDGRSNPIKLSPKGSTSAVNSFAEACNIDI